MNKKAPVKSRLSVLKRLQKLLQVKHSPLKQGATGSFVFVHINKTAGTSIGRAIGLPDKDHLTAKEIISMIGRQNWDGAYKFTVVRNPWDKVVSLYEYRRKKNKTLIASRGVSFTDWVKLTHGQNQDPFYYNNPKSFQTQLEWLRDDEDGIAIDYVARFETLHADFEQIKTAIGCNANLPHLNASSRKNFKEYYTAESRDIIARWYQQDIDFFAYTFD